MAVAAGWVLGLGVEAATSPFAGFYSGLLHVRVAGAITVPESPIGPVFYTVDGDGNLSGSGQGTVDAAGHITWQANDLGFTTGTVSGAVLAAQASRESGGTTTTYRIEARNNATGFGSGSTVAQGFSWRLPSPVGGVMRGVAWGDGKYVAVGPAGTVAVSGNGTDWVSAFTPTSVQLNAVAQGNGTFVAVGDAASVFTSPDGVTWTPRNLNADLVKQNVAGVAFGAGTFVAVNLINEVYTSTDGALWTKIATAPSGVTTWNNLKFVGGRFVLVGSLTTRGAVSTSPDGVNWSPTVSLASTGGILDVAHGNGKWVGVNLTRYFTFTAADASDLAAGAFSGLGDAVGFVNGTFVSDNRYFSTDGTNWRRETYPNLDVNDMVTVGERLVAVGGAMTSTFDGRNWFVHSAVMPAATVNGVFQHTLDSGTVSGRIHAEIEYHDVQGSPRWIRMGVGGLIAERTTANFTAGFVPVASPTTRTLRDGLAWVTTALGVGDGGAIVRYGSGVNAWTNVPSGTAANLLALAARNGNQFVAVGQAGTILRTTDAGQTWSPVASGTGHSLNCVVYLTGTGYNYYLAVGDHGVILKSTDGTAWTALESGTDQKLIGAAKRSGAGSLLILAREGVALFSDDHGVTWRSQELHAPYPLVRQNGATGYGEGGFTLLPYGGNTNWTYALPTVGNLTGAAFGSDRFVVLSQDARHVSADLKTWQTTPYAAPHHGVVYGDGQFISVGLGNASTKTGYVATSLDGVRWVDRAVPTTVILKGVTHGGGRYVAVGQTGTILSSDDGVTWTDRTITGTQELTAVTYGNGLFLAVGASGTVRLSPDGETWTARSSGTSSTLRGVAYGRGLFVAVGENGNIRTSTNGTAWTSRTTAPSSRRTFYTVRYAGGRFIALGEPDGSGNGAVLAHSQDGVVWTKENAVAPETINAMAAGNGTVIAVGYNGTLLAANYRDADSPLVTSQPQGRSLLAGQTLTLTATVVGAQPITYRWLRDGAPLANGGNISGADTLTLTVTGVGDADAGEYVLEAVNEQGGRRSQAAHVTVRPPPRIIQQPLNLAQSPGSTAIFTVAVQGDGPLTYVWKKNGVALASAGGISGQGTATLSVGNLRPADAGFYAVEISDGQASTLSRIAVLSVRSPVPDAVELTLDPAFSARVPALLPATVRNSATSVFTRFNPEAGVVQSDGKLIVVGTFEYLNAAGQLRNGIVRLNPDGSLDSGFDVPLLEGLRGGSFYSAAALKDVALLSDGRIVAVGEVARSGGAGGAMLSSGIVVLNPDGSRAAGFAPADLGYLHAVAVDSRDRVLTAGYFNLTSQKSIARLTPDGALDPNFNTQSLAIDDFFGGTLLIQPPDDRVLIHVSTGGYADSKVIRLRNTGELDTTFTSESFLGSPLHDLQLSPAGGILAPGRFPTVAGQSRRSLVRLQPDGALDLTFGDPGAASTVSPEFFSAVGFANGALIVGGVFRNILGTTITNLALLDRSGALIPSPTVGHGTDGTVLLVVGSADRRAIFVAGNTTNLNGAAVSRIFRLNATVGGELLPLKIAALSAGQAVPPGTTVVLSVAATGTGDLRYQWQRGGEPLPGQTGPQLVLENLTLAEAGNYSVVVNDARSSITSPDIPVTLANPETLAQWLADKGLTPGVNDGPEQDPDEDGMPTLGEFAFGTHPNRRDSVSRPRVLTVNLGGAEYPAVRFQRNRRAAGVTLQVVASGEVAFPSMVETIALPPVDLGGDLEEVTLRVNLPLGASDSLFFRLTVATP